MHLRACAHEHTNTTPRPAKVSTYRAHIPHSLNDSFSLHYIKVTHDQFLKILKLPSLPLSVTPSKPSLVRYRRNLQGFTPWHTGSKRCSNKCQGEHLPHTLQLQIYLYSLFPGFFSSYLTIWWFPKKKTNPSLV